MQNQKCKLPDQIMNEWIQHGCNYSHLEVQDAPICGNILQKIRTDQSTTDSIPVNDSHHRPPMNKAKTESWSPEYPKKQNYE